MEDKDLERLITSWLDGAATPQEHQLLEATLLEEEAARRIYEQHLTVHAGLVNRSTAEEYLHTLGGFQSDLPIVEESREQSRGTAWKTTSLIAFAALAVTLLFAFGIWPALSRSQLTDQPNNDKLSKRIAQSKPRINVGDDSSADSKWYIAQISGLSPDVRWVGASKAREFLLRVRRGDRLELESGLVEIEYFTGATITLRGPCEFISTGASTGRLVSGHLTGHVDEGEFKLTTPTAEVIDLGTDFGVHLDSSGNTDVYVMDGEVRVTNTAAGLNLDDSRLLKKGMAVRIERGAGFASLDNAGLDRFARALSAQPTTTANEVSLVGILSGLRNERFRPAGVIAADTGEPDRHPWLRVDGPGHSINSGYQITSWHPFVDGVFIPTVSGSRTQLDSANHVVDLPASMGRTWGPIWSRSRLEGTSAILSQQDHWGTDTLEVVIDQLKHCQAGMIGMHANVGITFDLEAISRQWGKVPAEFQAIVSNLENSLERSKRRGVDPNWAKNNRFSASLRVFVDGQLRESQLNFTRTDGQLNISAELNASDRFLTLVSSDAGHYLDGKVEHGHDAFDHVVLIDPVLSFSPLEKIN